MVKVAENKIVDLDVLPGTEEDRLKAKADALSKSGTDALPEGPAKDRAEGVAAGLTQTGQETLNTVGGGVKGVVDTAGNTVGTLGEGVAGTVGGVAGGVGNVVGSAGGAVRGGMAGKGEEEGVRGLEGDGERK
ncbi:hypothetical protein MMC21_007058 [Puttea exsequens]|nr:hypothetical protein [Puttea exsequens]